MTSLSIAQIDACRSAMSAGLQGLARKPPQTPVEWADDNFYLSSESSYQEGRWETLPFQVAMLNAMGNDEIRTVNVLKSARVGYSKLLIAVAGYMVEHKRRNILFLVPNDTSSDRFMKTQIETMIRDVPAVRDLAPWYGIKNHRDSTLDAKRFSHGKQLFCRGGNAATNYRELSVDTVIYDELAAFDHDIEKEGSPTFLGDKRVEGSSFPKCIRGSTPKIRGPVDEGGCQIEAAADESPHLFRLHVPCPHCGAEQSLKWGGKDCGFGIKWDPGNPLGAWYQCEVNACVIQQFEMQDQQSSGRWVCERTNIWTRDGLDFFGADDQTIPTPESVSFHIWTAYSPFTTWGRIASEFLLAKGASNTLKTFTNTTLGETWEEDQGEKVEWEMLFGRRETWAGVPARAVALMGGIDTQGDRYEGRVWAFGAGEECWLIHRFILPGNPASEELKRQVGLELHRQFVRSDGQIMKVERWCWDSGGHYTDEVYEQSRKHGVHWVIPIKGASVYGKPIANMPRSRNKLKKVYLTEVGTDNAKELIYSRLKLQVDTSRSQSGDPQPGVIHLPANDELCDEAELKQLTAETKILKIVGGRRVPRWDAAKRRNEALDCFVYALAALRISQQRFSLNLDLLEVAQGGGPPEEDDRPRKKSTFW